MGVETRKGWPSCANRYTTVLIAPSIMDEPAFRGQLISAGETQDLSFLDKNYTYKPSHL